MNKYQDALNKIRKKLTIVEKIKPQKSKKPQTLKEALDQAEGVSVTFACDKEIKTLQELVDKEKPKKPIRKRLYYNCINGDCDKAFIYYCPVCNASNVEDMNYCFKCGQKLD